MIPVLQSLEAMPGELPTDLAGEFTDIDDTLTTRGNLQPAAYAALERLRLAGLRVVPVTGRPAGWCDHIARMWPVDAVVGENGAFYFHRDGNGRLVKRYLYDTGTRKANRARLGAIKQAVLDKVPGAGIASDQRYRVSDLAVDFCEDVEPLPDSAVDEIVEIARSFGAVAKVSSIHVNIWFGDFDKLGMTRTLAAELFGDDDEALRRRYLFVGDSPNDCPMFDYFPLSVGVANVREFAERLRPPPRYVTGRPCGEGFVEVAELLCRHVQDR